MEVFKVWMGVFCKLVESSVYFQIYRGTSVIELWRDWLVTNRVTTKEVTLHARALLLTCDSKWASFIRKLVKEFPCITKFEQNFQFQLNLFSIKINLDTQSYVIKFKKVFDTNQPLYKKKPYKFQPIQKSLVKNFHCNLFFQQHATLFKLPDCPKKPEILNETFQTAISHPPALKSIQILPIHHDVDEWLRIKEEKSNKYFLIVHQTQY